MIEALRSVLTLDQRVGYAMLLGSLAREPERGDGDLAVGFRSGVRVSPGDLVELRARLEAAAGRPVDLVLMDEATPALAYLAFRDGVVLVMPDRGSFVDRKAKAILEYLDFRWVEEAFASAAAARQRL
jgi:predicted nucleotidyltransferase